MPSVDVYVLINNSILVLVEEIKEYLETKLLIQATQQDIINKCHCCTKSSTKLTLYKEKRNTTT
ncbi:hypothetical protein [Marinilactibacillus sp. Marseille-P9653]|uniref:hypothetical protein n=1 Tax=Marinilactibacillus sp. Marseille-P9653 TaxID=2866583 RepID=UPI001CE45662|nr:hypothetical protein [Marinilactibacillus sp. Marseille-P9653]